MAMWKITRGFHCVLTCVGRSGSSEIDIWQSMVIICDHHLFSLIRNLQKCSRYLETTSYLSPRSSLHAGEKPSFVRMIRTSNPHWLAHLSTPSLAREIGIVSWWNPHILGWNPWLFGRWNPKCLLLKTTLDASFSCLNPRKFIQFLHQTISNLHFWLASTPNFPWFSHIFATSMLRRDARPVVAQWTARCPCERPPNTKMRGLGHSGVPLVHGVTSLWRVLWFLDQWGPDLNDKHGDVTTFFLPGFYMMCWMIWMANGIWKGFNGVLNEDIYGEYNDNVMGYAKKIPTSNDPWSSCVARR